jgi:hypothetical protein
VENLEIRTHQFLFGGTGGLENFAYQVWQAVRKYSPDKTLDDPALAPAYDWLQDMVFRGAEQRIVYANLSEDLRKLQNALNDRLKT